MARKAPGFSGTPVNMEPFRPKPSACEIKYETEGVKDLRDAISVTITREVSIEEAKRIAAGYPGLTLDVDPALGEHLAAGYHKKHHGRENGTSKKKSNRAAGANQESNPPRRVQPGRKGGTAEDRDIHAGPLQGERKRARAGHGVHGRVDTRLGKTSAKTTAGKSKRADSGNAAPKTSEPKIAEWCPHSMCPHGYQNSFVCVNNKGGCRRGR